MSDQQARAARRRTATWAGVALLGLVSVAWAVFVALYTLDRDPDLGYMSDPLVGRVLVFVVVPGIAWLITALVVAVVSLMRQTIGSWLLLALSLVAVVAGFWIPMGATWS